MTKHLIVNRDVTLHSRRAAGGISREMIREAAQLEKVALFRIRNGTVTWDAEEDEKPAPVYARVLSSIAAFLPDMDFAVSDCQVDFKVDAFRLMRAGL